MKTRFYSLIVLGLLTAAFSFSPFSGPGEYVGHWNGIADGQIPFTLDIDIEDDELVAILNAQEQGLVDLTSEWSAFGGDHELKLSFEMPDQVTLTMEGALNDAGQYVGGYAFGEQFGSFMMDKAEEEATE